MTLMYSLNSNFHPTYINTHKYKYEFWLNMTDSIIAKLKSLNIGS